MASYFPHLSLTGPAPTTQEIIHAYRQAFLKKVSAGEVRPQVFPYNYLSILLGIIYISIPHKQNPVIYAARWPLLAFITWFELRVIQQTSGAGPFMGFTVGCQSAFIIMSAWTWLVFKRPQWDTKRVERRRVRVFRDVKKAPSSEKLPLNEEPCPESLASEDTYEYFWQSYPDNFWDRISWSVDLLLNYRGPGWDWSVPLIPRLTPEILNEKESAKSEKSCSKSSLARRECLKSQITCDVLKFIAGYLLVDATATLMTKDPYFKFGPNTYELHPYLQLLHPRVLYTLRMVLTGVMITSTMRTGYAACNALMGYILGPKVFGLRGEPYYYNQVWGSFSKVFERGLGGLWGNFWHQTFRHFFTAPTKYLIQGGYIKPGSFTTKLIGLAFAFLVSGFLHWAAITTAFGNGIPIHEVIFYGLQGVGVGLQDGACRILAPIITKFPTSIRKMGNLLFVLGWFYLTGWIEADNVARAGLFLGPVPFSLFTALGFGEHNSLWNIWSSVEVLWYNGKNWWESGVFFA